MNKRYQVFISSTFTDLQDERREVIQALLELDCFPAGMELFQAADQDQWSLIKGVIDECDYYVIVSAGRYGSTGPSGLSYTEMEYDYAIESGKPVIGFLHKDIGSIPSERCEATDEGKASLEGFRKKIQSKPCKFWTSPAELGSQVSRSLVKLIKDSPAIGWVRADLVPSEGANAEIISLRRRIEELQGKIQSVASEPPKGSEQFAQADDAISIKYTFARASSDHDFFSKKTINERIEMSWNEVFSTLAPHMINEATETDLANWLSNEIEDRATVGLRLESENQGMFLNEFRINLDSFQTIKIQLRALGLITENAKNRSVKDTETYWTLTPYGDNVMTRLRAIVRK